MTGWMVVTDGHGRPVTDLRVSLTDRCNMDCVYCHNEGLGDTRGPRDPMDDELTTDEVVRVVETVAEYGLTAVKYTGGEPLLRRDLETIVDRTPSSLEVSLTTNGTYLPGRAQALSDAGVERINVSLDTLDEAAFVEITESGAFGRVLEGVEAALDAGLAPVKLNTVVFEGTAPYVPDLVEHVADADGLRLQLIEYMPEIAGHPEWAVDIDRVHDWLAERADRTEYRDLHDRRRYWINGGLVEVVDPVENPAFCANCHRVRVTPDGRFTGCLNRQDDFHSIGGRTRSEIRTAFEATVAERVPYYGEYLVERDGEWVPNERYADLPNPE